MQCIISNADLDCCQINLYMHANTTRLTEKFGDIVGLNGSRKSTNRLYNGQKINVKGQ